MEEKVKKVAQTCDRLKEAMDDMGVKQSDISNATGINKGTISRYVLGKAEPKSNFIVPIARYLGVSEVWLWGFDVPKQRNASHERNLRVTGIVNRMRSDDDFLLLVEQIADLDKDQVKLIASLVSNFAVTKKQTQDQIE